MNWTDLRKISILLANPEETALCNNVSRQFFARIHVEFFVDKYSKNFRVEFHFYTFCSFQNVFLGQFLFNILTFICLIMHLLRMSWLYEPNL